MSERKLFLGKLNYVREREIKDVMSKFGKLADFDFKQNYAFVEFEKKEDCEKAFESVSRDIANKDNRLVKDIVIQKYGAHKKYGGKEDDACFNCGEKGHWASRCYLKRNGQPAPSSYGVSSMKYLYLIRSHIIYQYILHNR
jgi:arginine/serine-rich splicing factor 7